MVTHYDVGDHALVSAAFEVGGTPTDPGTVSAKVRDPSGTVTTYTVGTSAEIARKDTGDYVLDLALDAPGYWRYRFEGTDPASGAQAGVLVVDPDPFDTTTRSRALCTLEEAKEYAGEPLDDTTYDGLFVQLIDDCAEAFYRYTKREFTPVAVPDEGADPLERVFDLEHWNVRERRLAVGDLASTDGLTVKIAWLDGTPVVTRDPDGSVPSASIVALPRNRSAWEPITELWFPGIEVAYPAALTRYATATVAGDWGFPQVPSDVRRLAVVQVSIWFARDVAKFSGTFSLAEGHTIRPRFLDDAIRDGLDVGYRLVSFG